MADDYEIWARRELQSLRRRRRAPLESGIGGAEPLSAPAARLAAAADEALPSSQEVIASSANARRRALLWRYLVSVRRRGARSTRAIPPSSLPFHNTILFRFPLCSLYSVLLVLSVTSGDDGEGRREIPGGAGEELSSKSNGLGM